MMTQDQLDRIEAVREKLQDRRISLISMKTNISYPKLWQFKRGQSKTLTFDQLEALERYFEVMR